MKRLLLVLALLFPAMIMSQDAAQLPFTMRDVIEILAEYEVRQVPVLPPISGLNGSTSHITKTIHLYNADSATQRSTLIHEILHVIAWRRGLNPPEVVIMAREVELYNELFGK